MTVPVTLEDAYLVLMRLGSLPSRDRAGHASVQRGDGVPGAIASTPAVGGER